MRRFESELICLGYDLKFEFPLYKISRESLRNMEKDFTDFEDDLLILKRDCKP
jgi:hypothetical protein